MTITRDIRPSTSRTVKDQIKSIVPGSACIVTLVDRRTGSALRVNGSRIVVYTRAPEIAAEELLSGRDPSVWDVRIQPLDPARRLS